MLRRLSLIGGSSTLIIPEESKSMSDISLLPKQETPEAQRVHLQRIDTNSSDEGIELEANST